MKKHTDFSRTLYKIVACATLLLTVGVFLERSGKYYVGAEAGGERKHVCTSLEEAKKLADQNAVYGWSVFDFNGRLVYTTYSPLAAEILREAKTITDYVREDGFTYGDAPITPAIDCSAKKVSCDRLVCWVMYNVGFTDQPEQSGLFVYAAGGDPRDLPSWCERHGFEKITEESELQPGDIVFVNPKTTASGTVYAGHTFIHAGTGERSGEYYRYDCGMDERIRSVQPSSEPILNFMFAYRPVRG